MAKALNDPIEGGRSVYSSFLLLTRNMASSGAAEKPKFHEGTLKAYPHEELNPASDVSS
jgi:hypothetical protein